MDLSSLKNINVPWDRLRNILKMDKDENVKLWKIPALYAVKKYTGLEEKEGQELDESVNVEKRYNLLPWSQKCSEYLWTEVLFGCAEQEEYQREAFKKAEPKNIFQNRENPSRVINLYEMSLL